MDLREETVLVGIDIGTSSLKAVAYTVDGSRLLAYREPLSVIRVAGRENWFEQDVGEVLRALTRAMQGVFKHLGAKLYLVGLSSTSPSLLLLNRDLEPVGNAILWMDRRAVEEAIIIKEKLGSSSVYRRTGLHVDPMFTASKLLWVERNAPQLFKEARFAVQVKDYLFYKLTGETLTDKSHISETMLYTLDGRFYDEMLELLGVGEEMFFKPSDSTALFPLKGELSSLLGSRDSYVALGGVDSACATLGAGGFDPSIVVDTTGTSTCLDVSTEQPTLDPEERFEAYWHVVPGKYLVEACTPTGGEALRKVLELIGDKEGDPDRYLESREPSGLIVLPFLSGSRAPDWNPDLRGLVYGLSLSSSRGDLVKAFMEGVAFWERHILEEFEKLGFRPREVRLVGGGATQNWGTIKANVTGRRFSIPSERDASALGAAMLAGIGYGVYRSAGDAQTLVRAEHVIDPDAGIFAVYNRLYERYMELWRALQNIVDR